MDNNEGQEVHLIGDNSFTSPRPSIDVRAVSEYIKDLQGNLIALLRENQLVTDAEEPMLRVLQVHDIVTGVPMLPGYVFSTMKVLTKLDYETLKFDCLIEISHLVGELIEMVGMCPVIMVWPTRDYHEWKELNNIEAPYQGLIKIITLNELLY